MFMVFQDKKFDLEKMITIALLFINVVIVGIVFRVRMDAKPDADFQTYFKLALWVASLGFCMLYYRTWLKRALRLDNIFIVLFLVINLLSAFYSPLFYFSFGAIFTVICVFIFFYMACEKLENDTIFKTFFTAVSLISIASIIAYFVIPDFARYREWQNDVLVMGNRLCGITGSANHIGFISAFGLLIAFFIAQKNYTRNHFVFIFFALADITALVMSNSRTSMAALIIALFVVFMMKLTPQKIIAVTFSGIMGILLLSFIDIDTILSMLSRSGSSEEITSGTGRSEIWAVVINLIKENFFLGYGYASGLQILDEHASEVGFKVATTHNLVLQLFLNAGFISFITFVIALLLKTYTAFKNQNDFIISGLIFIMIIGLSESVAFQGVANTSTVALALIFGVRYGQDK